MSFLASKLDLDQSLVEVRHSATHAELPSLNILVREMNNAMLWLRLNYWDRQSYNHSTSLINIKNSLLDYRLKVTTMLRKGQVRLLEQGESIDEIVQHCDTLNMIQDTVVPLLLEEGCLLPSEDILQSSLMKSWLKNHYEQNNQKNHKIPLETVSDPPRPLIDVWFPVIETFTKKWPHFYSVLLQSMVQMLLKSNIIQEETKQTKMISFDISSNNGGTNNILLTKEDVRNLILCSWISFLVPKFSEDKTTSKKEQKKINQNKSKSFHKNAKNKKKPSDPLNLLVVQQETLQPNFKILWRQTIVIHHIWARFLSNYFYLQFNDKNSSDDTIISKLNHLNCKIENLIETDFSIANGFFGNLEKLKQKPTAMEIENTGKNSPNTLEDFEALLKVC